MAKVRVAVRILLLTVYFCSVYCDDPKVVITATDPPLDPVYRTIIQEKDKDVQLTCIVENKLDKADVTWTVQSTKKDSSVVQIATATRSYDAFRWAIDKPSSTAWRLRIQNAQVADEGIYTCRVQVTDQNYIKDQRELVIVQKPQISDLDTSSDMTKSANDNARLDCYATGRPEPIVKWTRMAGELLPNGGTEYQGSTLVVDRIQSDHAGIYKCSASNSAGTDTREIRITVNFRPELYTGTPVARQAEGYMKQLVCNIKGYPPPTGEQISWSHEGRPVIPSSRVEIRNIPGASNRITSILAINGVRSSDFGQYTCQASNDKGTGSVNMELLSSPTPTSDRSHSVRNAAAILSSQAVATLLMLMAVWLAHKL